MSEVLLGLNPGESPCIFEDAVWHALIAQLTTFLLHPGERGRERERESSGPNELRSSNSKDGGERRGGGGGELRLNRRADDDGGGRASSVTD